MGNCFHRCFGVVDRKYPKSRYTAEQDFSIEFESLIGEESSQNEMTRLLTNHERQLLSTRQFGVLVHEQSKIDAELEAKQAQDEREIEREEATFHEAKREAAQVAKLNKAKENSSRSNSKAWVNSDEWEIAGDDDDFENFLADVRARSLVSRSHEKSGPSDAQISSNSNIHNKGSSVEQMAEITVHLAQNSGNGWPNTSTATSRHSSDLEWDPDFVSAEDENRTKILNL